MKQSIEVGPDNAGNRLDVVISLAVPQVSRTIVQKLIASGHVTVDGRNRKPSDRVHGGEVVDIELILPPSLSAAPQSMELSVVYEDECIAVIDKPAGMVVHPAPGHSDGTLVNGLVERYPWIAGSAGLRPGLVHRLDKNTSGLIVVALDPAAQMGLSGQLKSKTMRRQYIALVSGRTEPEQALIDIPIGRDSVSRKRMAAGEGSIRPRSAQTRYSVAEYLSAFSLIDVFLQTGRTHQIRVHMAYIGHPVVGDALYGGPPVTGLDRQFLHAAVLELDHPVSGEHVRFESALPKDLARVLERLGTQSTEDL